LTSKIEGLDLETLPSPLLLKKKILLKVRPQARGFNLTYRANISLQRGTIQNPHQQKHLQYHLSQNVKLKTSQKTHRAQKNVVTGVVIKINHLKSRRSVLFPSLVSTQLQPIITRFPILFPNSSITFTPFPNVRSRNY
jgi:hypothetical protein